MLRLEGVCKAFGRGRAVVADGIDLDLGTGDVIGLVGPSGGGKSTLGRMALGLTRPDAGRVLFHGRDLRRLDRAGRRRLRRSVQLVPQHPDAAFNPRLTVGASLREVFRFHPVCPREEREDYLRATLGHVRVHPELLARRPHALSGGELQRLAIARAILTKPEVLVLDEVTSMLDVSVQAGIVRTLEALHREHGGTFLFICHDLPLARVFCDRVLRLEHGRLGAVA